MGSRIARRAIRFLTAGRLGERVGQAPAEPKRGGTQMKLRWILRIAAVVAVLGLTVAATNADEATLSMHAKLSGFQEGTPKLSPSTGHFEATVTGSALSYPLTYSQLSIPPFLLPIHFHLPSHPRALSP